MNQLAEARKILLSTDVFHEPMTIDALWNDEKQTWVQLGSDLLTSGCLWDETKEFPIQHIISHFIQSKVVGALVERMYTKVQK